MAECGDWVKDNLNYSWKNKNSFNSSTFCLSQLDWTDLEESWSEPGLSADSLEDMSREAEATPGLQQLARVLTIQLQVLNGADDLCMHVSNHTQHTHTPSVEREGGGGEFGEQQKEEGKEKKEKKKT